MRRTGLPLEKVRAIFVSHEHTDHISGIEVLAHRYRLPVYITPHTYRNSRLQLDPTLVAPFEAGQPIRIGGLTVTPFRKLHDACDPHSFLVSDDRVTIGVFTDIGRACGEVVRHFSRCHAAFLEANYDEQLLREGRYPLHLQRRISGGRGHLSNHEALELFRQHKPAYMSHLLLAHLSRDNNRPELAQELFRAHAGGTEIIVASRYEASAVYAIEGLPVVSGLQLQAPSLVRQGQLSLF